MKVKYLGLLLLVPFCATGKAPVGKHVSNHKVTVQEVLQTTSYTYLYVKENDSLSWLAVPKMDAQTGHTYYYSEGLPMTEFESKELHRTFAKVLFLGGVSEQPIGTEQPNPHAGGTEGYTRKSGTEARKDIKISVPAGCISIADLFAHKSDYEGKTVKVYGQVTKYSPQIMNKNWIHIQDGTTANGKYDLTITSMDEAKIDELVTFEGKVVADKDFGYGYKFEVMLEDAHLR